MPKLQPNHQKQRFATCPLGHAIASTDRSPGPQAPQAVGTLARCEYVPGEQATQVVLLEGATDPARHGAHSLLPGTAARPGGQALLQEAAPVWEKGRSAGQAAHEDEPSEGAWVPALHWMQALCPTVAEEPGAHGVHAVRPVPANVPRAQVLHAATSAPNAVE